MSRRDKLIEKMRDHPATIRFAEIESILRHSGFDLVNRRGSHRTYRGSNGRVLVFIRPHGRFKTCHPNEVQKLLEALGR